MANRLLVAFTLCLAGSLSRSLAQAPAPSAKPADAKATDAAVEAGIAWLLRHQDETGGWSASQFVRHDPKDQLCTGTGKPDQDLHVTAWATFALLGHGTTGSGPKWHAVARALAWLRSQMQADGFVGAPEAGNAVAAHAVASIAIAEVSAMSDLEPSKAMFQRLHRLRLPDGTWPAKLGESKGDPMATYWASMACVTGTVYETVASVDLESTLSAMQKGMLAAPTPPAVELMVRGFAQHDAKTDERLTELVDALGKQLPRWRDGEDAAHMDFLEWHVGTLAMMRTGGEAWDTWYAALDAALVAHQRTDGSHAGSWDPIDANGKQCGRVYATAINVYSLSLGQRVTRMKMQRGNGANK